MTIETAQKNDKKEWNEFIRGHYPPVGGFMQSWEWGLFQERLGRKVERYFVIDGVTPVAAFTLIHYSLPMGLTYGYAARGPALAVSQGDKIAEVFETVRKWASDKFPNFIFLRLEPPIPAIPTELSRDHFRVPPYYIQPRYNLTVSTDKPDEEILSLFHPSTRSNVARAEKRGVTVKIKTDITSHEYERFSDMMRDTITRNSGTNAYPGKYYFDALFSALAQNNTLASDPHGLSLAAFYGYHNGESAATHFVLFFDKTATYLYGASYSNHLSSKVTTYLHWAAIQEAKRRGMHYYDLGGIDEARWPTLTQFKRQFRGREFSYVGNIDMPIRPAVYLVYDAIRRLRK